MQSSTPRPIRIATVTADSLLQKRRIMEDSPAGTICDTTSSTVSGNKVEACMEKIAWRPGVLVVTPPAFAKVGEAHLLRP
jgi:hypothetical protein